MNISTEWHTNYIPNQIKIIYWDNIKWTRNPACAVCTVRALFCVYAWANLSVCRPLWAMEMKRLLYKIKHFGLVPAWSSSSRLQLPSNNPNLLWFREARQGDCMNSNCQRCARCGQHLAAEMLQSSSGLMPIFTQSDGRPREKKRSVALALFSVCSTHARLDVICHVVHPCKLEMTRDYHGNGSEQRAWRMNNRTSLPIISRMSGWWLRLVTRKFE